MMQEREGRIAGEMPLSREGGLGCRAGREGWPQDHRQFICDRRESTVCVWAPMHMVGRCGSGNLWKFSPGCYIFFFFFFREVESKIMSRG